MHPCTVIIIASGASIMASGTSIIATVLSGGCGAVSWNGQGRIMTCPSFTSGSWPVLDLGTDGHTENIALYEFRKHRTALGESARITVN